MYDPQALTAKIKKDLQEGRSGAEICQDLIPLFGKDPQKDEVFADLLGSIPDREIGTVLNRLLDTCREKRVRKALKRSLYRLKSRGVPIVEGPSEEGKSILKPIEAQPGQGLASAIDHLGNRLLLIGLPQGGHGWMVMQGIVNDTEGVLDFSAEEMSRKGFRSALDEVRESTSLPVVEMDSEYAAFLFSKAHRLTAEQKRTPPVDYLRVRSELERHRKEYETALIYEKIKREEISENEWLLQRAGELAKSDPLFHWSIEEDRIETYANSVQDTQESRIVLNQSQKEFRLQEIYLDALTELFPEARRLLFKERLEETAYVLLNVARFEDARAAAAAAVDLEKPLNPIRPNPFLFQLVIRSIHARLAEAKEKDENQPSFIIKP